MNKKSGIPSGDIIPSNPKDGELFRQRSGDAWRLLMYVESHQRWVILPQDFYYD
jgi:hypothetical protein